MGLNCVRSNPCIAARMMMYFLFSASIVLGGCHYRVEESASRISLAIVWDNNAGFNAVTCYRFTQASEARRFLESRKQGEPAHNNAIKLSNSGDTITVTQLRSGFTSSRLLHKCLVFELLQENGVTDYKLEMLSGATIERGYLVLSRSQKRIGTGNQSGGESEGRRDGENADDDGEQP